MKIKHYHKSLVIIICLLNLIGNEVTAQDITHPEGIWIGKMEVNKNVQMTIAFEISKDDNNNYQALMHSIDQDAFDNPASEITVMENNVSIRVTPLNITYEAILLGSTMEGFITQGNNSPWKLNMDKVKKLPGKKTERLQEPKRPYPYLEEKVTYPNEAGNVKLGGTLTLPFGEGLFPTVILISGSGKTDRDATIFGHKYFLVLADQLTRAGYGVLRVDDRGTGESTGNFESATVVDLADDVIAGVDYLKTRNDINKDQIGLIGHSLGAVKAPIAESKSGDIAFVVMMAGASITLEEGIIEQTEAFYTGNLSIEAVTLNTKILRTAFETIRHEIDNDKALETLELKFEKLNPEVARLTQEERKVLKLSHPLNTNKYKFFMSPSMRFDLFYEHSKSIEKMESPVLVLNGSLDLQVLPHNVIGVQKALKKGGNKNFTGKIFEGKNHLFQNAVTGTPDEYGKIEETISPDVIEFMVSWMNSITQ